MLEVPQQGIYLNLILQSFAGHDIHKLEGKYCACHENEEPKFNVPSFS